MLAERPTVALMAVVVPGSTIDESLFDLVRKNKSAKNKYIIIYFWAETG
jgi:hypothetical protein